MATSYLTKGSTKKAASGKGSKTTSAKDEGEKEVKGSAKKKVEKAARKGSGASAPAAPRAGAKETAAAGGAKKTTAASGGAKKTAVTQSSAKKTASSGAAKKTASRAAPKESPMKGMAIEQWLKEKASGWQAQAVTKIVALVRAAVPDATASIKWGQPVFESNGPFAYVRPAKAHVTLGFWRGNEIADPKGLLDGGGDRMQHLKIASLDAIDAAAITAMVKDAVRLNREKGTPTMRGNA